jgi:transcriptional regulator with XRE-family HTH domain
MAKKPTPKNYIAYYRNLRDLTQEELGECVGTSQTQIMRLETGRRKFTLEWAEALSKPLLCSSKELLFGPEQKLSSEEKKALDAFRGLPEHQRDAYLEMMEAMSNKWKKEKNS